LGLRTRTVQQCSPASSGPLSPVSSEPATAAEIGADTLQERLSDELAAAAAVFAHPPLFSAWTTIDLAK
jgi:hypothetical protein